MLYEVVYKIENTCKANQMRDVFFEDIPGGIRYRVVSANLLTVYELTPAD